jgi:hypothetical protein
LILIEPYYNCEYCSNFYKDFNKKFNDINSEIRITYIGAISPIRMPINDILKELNKLSYKGIKILFRLYSNRIIPNKVVLQDINFKRENLEILLIPKKLSKVEKHEILLDSHIFLFTPKGRVTMDPSISLLEAVYHLAIPIVSCNLSGSEYLPYINVVRNTTQIASRIMFIRSLLMENKYSFDKLLNNFSRFYDRSRFLSQAKRLKEIA